MQTTFTNTSASTSADASANTLDAGKLGELQIEDNIVQVGDPITFTDENIDDYQF